MLLLQFHREMKSSEIYTFIVCASIKHRVVLSKVQILLNTRFMNCTVIINNVKTNPTRLYFVLSVNNFTLKCGYKINFFFQINKLV